MWTFIYTPGTFPHHIHFASGEHQCITLIYSKLHAGLRFQTGQKVSIVSIFCNWRFSLWGHFTTKTSIPCKFSFIFKFVIPLEISKTICTNCDTKESKQIILVLVVWRYNVNRLLISQISFWKKPKSKGHIKMFTGEELIWYIEVLEPSKP